MATYNRVTCPITPAIEAAIEASQKASVVVRLRPTWSNDHERLTFGVFSSDPATPSHRFGCGPYVDCQSNRTGGGIYNRLGVGWRLKDSLAVYGYVTPSPIEAADQWFELGCTIDISSANVARIFVRSNPTDAWTFVNQSSGGALPGTLGVEPPGNVLYLGNRYTDFPGQGPTEERWPGGIASASLRIGVGPGNIPGGVEIAEWHPDPPHDHYVDAYGNEWTITGPDWSWSSTV